MNISLLSIKAFIFEFIIHVVINTGCLFFSAETLRKYPPVTFLTRRCNKDCRISGTDLVLEKGVQVVIPVLGLHQDPEYFPDPEKFLPERFTEENKNQRPNYVYLPFGEGPRVCIGAYDKPGYCFDLVIFLL
jgi:hypothetical protein